MSGTLEQAKRSVSPRLAGPDGHQFHPILVTVPIGAWVTSETIQAEGYQR